MIPEFMGRLPIIVAADDLDVDMLVEILWKPKNALAKQYERLFEMEGVKLRFTEDALQGVAEEATRRKSGARGLRAILEEVMLDVMYEIPVADRRQRVRGDPGRGRVARAARSSCARRKPVRERLASTGNRLKLFLRRSSQRRLRLGVGSLPLSDPSLELPEVMRTFRC